MVDGTAHTIGKPWKQKEGIGRSKTNYSIDENTFEGDGIVKRLFLVVTVVLLMGLCTPVLAGSQDFTLENQTGLDLFEIYISPYSSDDWEEEILQGDILLDGHSIEIVFDNRAETYWDLMVKDGDGNNFIWRKFNLKEITRITLYYDGKDLWAEYE